MKERPVLIIAIILTLLFELTLIVLVYNKVGTERLPVQIGRLTVQLILIFWILGSKSNIGIFLLAAYHIVFEGIFGIISGGSRDILSEVIIGYNFVIGIVIYLHDWIENIIGMKKGD